MEENSQLEIPLPDVSGDSYRFLFSDSDQCLTDSSENMDVMSRQSMSFPLGTSGECKGCLFELNPVKQIQQCPQCNTESQQIDNINELYNNELHTNITN